MPEALQQVDAGAVLKMLAAVDAALATLAAPRLKQLLLVGSSRRYLDRCAAAATRLLAPSACAARLPRRSPGLAAGCRLPRPAQWPGSGGPRPLVPCCTGCPDLSACSRWSPHAGGAAAGRRPATASHKPRHAPPASSTPWRRLAANLQRRAGQEARLLAAAREVAARQQEARAALVGLHPRVAELVERTKRLKAHVEKVMPGLVNGRGVNILGDINTVLFQGS
jgi:hypothetical protein